MNLEEMSKNEKNLLLFFETRAVDYGGRVSLVYMNRDDMKIAEKWNESGFVFFGRIVIRHHNKDGTNWCRLSEEAWKLAHQERKARHKRMWEKRDWISTSESQEIHGHPHVNGMNSQ